MFNFQRSFIIAIPIRSAVDVDLGNPAWLDVDAHLVQEVVGVLLVKICERDDADGLSGAGCSLIVQWLHVVVADEILRCQVERAGGSEGVPVFHALDCIRMIVLPTMHRMLLVIFDGAFGAFGA